MLENKQMDSHIVINLIEAFKLTFRCYLLFSNLVAPFNLLDKSEVFVLNIAFLKDDWCYFMLVCHLCSL